MNFDPQGLLLNLLDKINLQRSDKYVALSSLSIYCTWKNIKGHKKIINLKHQLHGMKSLNEEFHLPEGSYSVSDIQDYFKYMFKNMR